MKDPYKCSPRVQAKWICARNVVSANCRFIMIMKQIALYGTSESMLDIKKGIKNIRDFMIPESGKDIVKFKVTLIDSDPDWFMID